MSGNIVPATPQEVLDRAALISGVPGEPVTVVMIVALVTLTVIADSGSAGSAAAADAMAIARRGLGDSLVDKFLGRGDGMSDGLGFVVEELFVFVAVHSDGDEGVVGARINGTWMPLVAADRKRLDQLRPIAGEIASVTGKPIRLVRFTTRTELEVIRP